MLTKEKKGQLRDDLFRHLDGIVTVPTAFALHKAGVLDVLLAKKTVQLSTLSQEFKANEGYLNVALRTLCAQNWLKQAVNNESDEVSFSTNENSEFAFSLMPMYEEAVALMQKGQPLSKLQFEGAAFDQLSKLFELHRLNWDIEFSEIESERQIQQQILKHIEGVIVGPIIVSMGMGGMFHKYFSIASFRPEEFHKDHERFKEVLDFFTHLGWFNEKKGIYKFNDVGLFFAKRASAYGVTVSYIPTFRKINELLFGNPNVLWDRPDNSPEIHVDRRMNVWGSGGAHTNYFKKIDEIVRDLFNKPIHQQPKGIVDMGCGNGAFLEHIFDVIATQTKRGELLDEHPLFIVGADFNEAALSVTRANLIQADIWAKVIFGDIGRPDLLANDLMEDYGIDLGDLLNVRSFLDHNRIWEGLDANGRLSTSSGAFAFRGKRLNNNAVEQNLVAHLSKWAPYVKKFGLLVIELHTIDPALTAQNIGRTAATAYDATHGFSDQYIMEVDVFLKAAKEAGLEPAYQSKYPNSDLATVTINLLKG